MRAGAWAFKEGPLSLAYVIASLLMAFALRAGLLDRQSLWGDEAASVSYAHSADLLTLVERLLATDPHPPLYYSILHLWTRVAGDSDFAVRWPSVFFGALSVPLTYTVARRIFGTGRLPRLILLFTAVSPFMVYYSQEARMYSMAAFLSLLAIYSLGRAVADGGWWWLGYCGAGIASLLTLTVTVALIPAGYCFVAWGLLRRQWRAPVKTAVAATVSTIVLVAVFLLWNVMQMDQLGKLTVAMDLSPFLLLATDTVKETLLAGVFGVTLDPLYSVARTYQTIASWEQVYQPVYTSAVVLLVSGLAGWGVLSFRRSGRPAAFWLPALFIVAVLCEAYILRLTTSRYASRLTFIAAPFLLMVVGLGVAALPGRVLRVTASCVVTLGMGYSLWQNYENPAFSRSEYRVLATYLQREIEQGDAVYLHGPTLSLLDIHYFPSPHPVYSVPGSVPVTRNWPETEAQLESLRASHARLWLVLSGETDYDPDRRVEGWLMQHGYRVDDQWFGNTRLGLFLFSQDSGTDAFAPRSVSDRLALVGSAIGDSKDLIPGQGLPLSMTWLLPSVPETGLRLSLRLLDSEGLMWVQRDQDLGGHLSPVGAWPQDMPVTTRTGIRIPVGIPPGDYVLRALVYEASGRQLPGGDLGSVAVHVSPGPPADAARLNPSNRTHLPLGPLRVIGYYLPQQVSPGEKVLLRLYWEAETRPVEDFSLAVRLGGGQEDVLPLTPANPTSRWREGEALISQNLVRVPAAASGRLPVAVGLVGAASVGPVRLTQVGVVEVKRSFQDSPSQRQYRADLEGKVELTGLDIDRASPDGILTVPPGSRVNLVLHWKVLEEMERSHIVFVQLLDSYGRLVAQDDAVPVQGGRPTTSWLPGEAILDVHALNVPADMLPGRYELIAGMYDAATGRRLETVDGDFVRLMEVALADD